MQDRFKLRFWDKKEKEYFTCGNIDHKSGIFKTYPYRTYNWCFKHKNIIAEQCTGLKDKNGKLIYDNDFIRAINQDTKDKPDLQIGHIWVDEMGCRWIKFKTEELSWNDFCSLIDYDGTLTIEVIGNIHEETEK